MINTKKNLQALLFDTFNIKTVITHYYKISKEIVGFFDTHIHPTQLTYALLQGQYL